MSAELVSNLEFLVNVSFGASWEDCGAPNPDLDQMSDIGQFTLMLVHEGRNLPNFERNLIFFH